ncbi:DUF883 family protein [Mesobacterium pallidum]|uniref:DUF883 family protein n=1 Tax=Mesobacterium pallidum TaxID=2872037 RepID=UPI001EE39A49|nr:hypothetical protein [Mesobacterium pallidum]
MATAQAPASVKAKASNGKPELEKEKAEMEQDSIEKQLATIREDISKLTSSLAELGRAQGTAAKENVKATAAELRAKGEDNVRYAQDQLTAAAHRAETSVRENPGAAVGIAAGIGFVVGLLMSSRR